MSDDADSHKLLAVVATIHHEGVGEALDDGAIGLAEALDGITTCGVRDVNGGANLDVVAVGKVESATQHSQATVEEENHHPQSSFSSDSSKIQVLSRVLTSMRYLGLRRPRMTIC